MRKGIGSQNRRPRVTVPGHKRLSLAMQTEERTARLESMVTTQLRLALETEEERRAKIGLDMIWI